MWWYRSKIFQLFLTVILGFITMVVNSQEVPPITNFKATTYQAENQNWEIGQDRNGFIYFANNNGLLEYNGASWHLNPSPNNTIIRSVFTTGDTIYSGAYMEFGFWARNETGKLDYTSISSTLTEGLIEDEIFWNIVQIKKWIIFQSYDRLYFYNTVERTVHHYTDKNNYQKIFNVDGRLYILKFNGTITTIESGKEIVLQELPVHYRIKLIVNLFKAEDKIIALTRNRGFFIWEDGNFTKWKMPADSMLENSKVFNGIRLSDNSYVLGTISKGLYHLDTTGEIQYNIDQTNGLNNNTVLNLFEDIRGNVWAALDNGIDCLNMQSYLKEYNDNSGKVGTTYTSILFNDTLYVGSNQGLFFKSANNSEKLTLVKGSRGQVWSLFIFKDQLFCGHTTGAFLVEGDRVRQIADTPGVWDFKVFDKDNNKLLYGHYSGLSFLEKKEEQWQSSSKIENFDISARFFELMPNENIYVNHEYKGLYKLTLSNDLKEFTDVETVLDIPKSNGSGLTKYQGKLLYGCRNGIYTLDAASGTFRKDTVLSKLTPMEDYISGKLVADSNDYLWSFNKSNMARLEQGLVSNEVVIQRIPIPNDKRKTTVSFENIRLIHDNQYIVGKTNGYLKLDLDKFNVLGGHKIYLNGVYKYYRDSLVPLGIVNETILKNKEASVKFAFSDPYFQKYKTVYYQYKLAGLDDTWSNWANETEVVYEKLPFGDYTFLVRSKIGNLISDNTAEFNFTVKRPVLLSNLAIAGYILAFCTLVYFIHKMYNRYYQKQHVKIINQNQRQIAFNTLQNEKELEKLKNEKLNQEIEAKNRELAISTMNIVQRNEFLRGIKRELKNSTNLSDNNAVFKLIDKNLGSSKDWKLFREAFNNADKNFLKRAKQKHPDLTPNDLKFCAYLRLNLTSKEIAPLLNIAVKSVEVRRYRLRKKLRLASDKNLTEYIMNM